MKLVFIGATGMLGKPVAKKLLEAGYDVTVFARDVIKTQRFFTRSKVIKGDVFDKESLLNAFTDKDVVYMNLSVAQNSKEKELQPEREGVKNIIEVAKQQGIKRLIYLSSLIKNYQGMNGFDWWAFELKQKAVAAIKSSGLTYTIFYPSTFMETFPYQMIRGSKIMMPGNSVAPMWFIAAEDFAKQVARSFEIAGNENKEYTIQGLEPFTFGEAAKLMIENYKKKKLKIIKAPIGLIKFLGKFNAKMNYGATICEALNNYPEKFESGETWKELGKPVISLKDYASAF